MSQRKRNPGAIRDLESIVNPLTGDINTGTGGITMNGTQIRHPVQFGPVLFGTSSAVYLITDIATWANEIDVIVINMSPAGAAPPLFVLGTLTGLVTAGYLGAVTREVDAVAIGGVNHSNAFRLNSNTASGHIIDGHIHLQRHGTATSNIWGFSWVAGRQDVAGTHHAAGHISLPGPLTTLAFLCTSSAFDSGEASGRYKY